MELFITFILGVFVLAGAIVAGLAKDEEHIREVSIAVALGAILVLLVLDLVPEAIEGAGSIGWPLTVVAAAIGFLVLVLLDRFLPESPGTGHRAHASNSALHISIVTTIALSIHNVIEGMSVYGVATQSTSTALMLAFGIGIHNVPMGMIVYSGVRGQPGLQRGAVMGAAVLSTFVGGLIMFALGSSVNGEIVSFMVALTIGLLSYIITCELLPHVLRVRDRRLSFLGFLVGAAFVLIGVFIARLA